MMAGVADADDERGCVGRDAALAELHREHYRSLVRLARLLVERECLVLRYYSDLSEADIASTLGISAGSVKSHSHRGVAALARALQEES